MQWIQQACSPIDHEASNAAQERQLQLTKPPGSLGKLEKLAIRLAGMQSTPLPSMERVHISVFAADHGLAAEGVSAFPQEVTVQMVQNFLNGGAAINVLARELQAQLEIIDVGIKTPLQHSQLISQRAGHGTANAAHTAAMTLEQLEQAMLTGKQALERAQQQQAHLFIGGEMGIGNTTPATALYCYLLNLPPEPLTGAGTGLDEAGIRHKTTVIQHILDRHLPHCTSPLEALRLMGGFELAALTGAYLRAAQLGVPAMVDGFICTAAALLASRLQPDVMDWLFLSHHSAEAGYTLAIAAFPEAPLLDLGLRLGEGSGAASAVPLLRLACALHQNMATFAEAAVATKL